MVELSSGWRQVRSLLTRKRQSNRKSRAFAEPGAFGGDGPAVHRDQFLRDGKAEADSVIGTRVWSMDLPEAIEDIRQLLGIDADAIVL